MVVIFIIFSDWKDSEVLLYFFLMNTLYFLHETFTNNYRGEFLDITSILAILCGILVIITKNPIVSVLFLIGLFLSIAGYLMLLGLILLVFHIY